MFEARPFGDFWRNIYVCCWFSKRLLDFWAVSKVDQLGKYLIRWESAVADHIRSRRFKGTERISECWQLMDKHLFSFWSAYLKFNPNDLMKEKIVSDYVLDPCGNYRGCAQLWDVYKPEVTIVIIWRWIKLNREAVAAKWTDLSLEQKIWVHTPARHSKFFQRNYSPATLFWANFPQTGNFLQ